MEHGAVDSEIKEPGGAGLWKSSARQYEAN